MYAERQAEADKKAEARRREDRRAIEGERRTSGFAGPEVAEGWSIVDRGAGRRTLAGGRAAQWFESRNKSRLAQQGVGLARTTEMGRPDMGTDGKQNTAERTNQLLEEIKERLA